MIIWKSKYATFTSNGNGVYLDTSEFDGKNTISIYVTINYGKFNEFLVFYGDTDIEPIIGSSVELENYKSSDSSSYTKRFVDTYTFKKYYNIPKPSVRYLLLSVPKFLGSSAEIGISNGFPLWAIILIVFEALIFIGIILNININNLNI